MNVEIITIGDELLIGQVIDTNSAWIGQTLGNEGFRVVWRTTVGDNEQDMLDAFDAAMKRAQIVLVTGGIGPTKDDITKQTLCKYFQTKMRFSQEVYDNIETLFSKSGKVMNELTRNQALVPVDCTVIQNKAGTAPVTWFERDGKILVSMPGVPYEMKWIMSNEIIPRLKRQFLQDVYIKHHTCWVKGYTESMLAIKLTQFEEELPDSIKLAYLPQPGIIRLRLSAYCESESQALHHITEQGVKLRVLLGESIIVEEDKPVQELIGELLKNKSLTLGTAESCTGGRIASLITSMPGSSDYFVGSVVCYANHVKEQMLGVHKDVLEREGAVSKEVVEQMALGTLNALGCDCSVATSGIAGPGGGTTEKPVGTVWIAAAYKDKVRSEVFHFGTNREQNMLRASNMALLMLLDLLQ
jgi:nicotinamide-nucleotide amidase